MRVEVALLGTVVAGAGLGSGVLWLLGVGGEELAGRKWDRLPVGARGDAQGGPEAVRIRLLPALTGGRGGRSPRERSRDKARRSSPPRELG